MAGRPEPNATKTAKPQAILETCPSGEEPPEANPSRRRQNPAKATQPVDPGSTPSKTLSGHRDPAFLRQLNAQADHPDLAVILEADPAVIAQRLEERGPHNRFSSAPAAPKPPNA
ncbi:MAG: hypothetical protein WBA97_10290 [Actinophytocola sp.]|uniref:hypothetical protein n=1 Tax=Actinophytocola sp. TaxID=1872138 RepID=UPI003C792151